MSPKIIDKEAKKAEILQAAMQVFSRKGVAKTRMADIAVAAGIGKGTIYEYFRSKEEIFAAAFQQVNQRAANLIGQSLQTTDDPVEQLRLLIDVSRQTFIEESADFAGIMMDFWAEGIRNKDEKILGTINLEQIYTEYRSLISGILNDGIQKGVFRPVDTASLAAIIIAALDGVMLQWIMTPELIDMKKITDVLIDGLMNGIKRSD